jgi:hypothetical protein
MSVILITGSSTDIGNLLTIAAVRQLTADYDAHLPAADAVPAGLAARTGPEHSSEVEVHPAPAGQAALADVRLRMVA